MVYRTKDVAKRAGVSVATVSRVLNNARYVDAKTRQRVLAVARKLKYYRNAHARRLANRRSELVGLIVSEIANPYYPEVIRSFEAATLRRHLEVLLYNTEYGPDRIEASVQKMIENKVQGVAALTSVIGTDHIKEFAASRMPVVAIDHGQPERWVSCIRTDYARGVRQAVDRLIKIGHSRFAFVSGPPGIPSARALREAVKNVLRSRKLGPVLILEGNHRVDGGFAAAAGLLAAKPRPTAVICGNDLTALGVINGLEAAGRGVPGDFSVVGCDDIYFAHLARPPLTTIRIPRDKLGELALETLMRLSKSKSHQGETVSLPTEFVERESTGQASRARSVLKQQR